MPAPEPRIRYKTTEEVDFLIVGSGASGGVLARELSTAGFSVVVLEQGPYRTAADFNHDELDNFFGSGLTGHPSWPDYQTFRRDESEKAVVRDGTNGPPAALYARGVGGSSVHFSGNYWRMRPLDFQERSLLGPIADTGFADWPISYEELEPYYSKVEWEIGVSGAPGPFDPPRSRPYPLPPMTVKSSGVLFEQGARKIGLHPQPAPVAILSQPYNGRPACTSCGFCMSYGCEMNAKSSTLATVIPQAELTGRCEIRPLSTVFRLDSNTQGKMTGASYLDAQGQQHQQKAKAVILAANGAETARLLLMSESSLFPNGLANGSGLVGKYLMANCHSVVHGYFEHELNDWKGIQCTRIAHDFYENDPARGFYGGGGLDGRPMVEAGPIMHALTEANMPRLRWGRELKRDIVHDFSRRMAILASTTSLPLERNNITLDPDHKDAHGRPLVRMTYRDHEDDLAMAAFLQDRGEEILQAAGAQRTLREPVVPQNLLAHLLGTCRMGNDPATSVVDRHHRSHEVPNLFICDGSSLVTSGRGQPTLTIQALAFRAAEHIAGFASKGEIG
ncbi:MAG TPA: GMC family oxidoreductase [Xanthomonadales bacterium]|nr:GMC family oxidoreductase [Xanthomonadales bacterium]